MFGTKQLFKLGLFIDGMVFGTAGITILRLRDAECAYTHAIAAVLRDKDCVMKTISTPRENYGDIYEDARDLSERCHAAGVERAYQEVKALIEKHETTTEA